jgi:hypothetical protein
MINKDRISRKERAKRFQILKGALAVALALFAVAAVYYRMKKPVIIKPKFEPPIAKILPKTDIRALSDSLIIAGCQSFGLSDDVALDSVIGQPIGFSGLPFHSFHQNWPDELPFISFAERLSRVAAERGINCDCLESQKGNWLNCSLKSGTSVGGRILVSSNRDTKLTGREIAIIISNFGAMKKEDITRLIRAGYTFGYLASFDAIPTDDLRKLFARANITPILSLPANKTGWASLAQQFRIVKGTGKLSKDRGFEFNNAIVADAISRQSAAKTFTFDISSKCDPLVIKTVLDEAKRAKLTYIDNNGADISIDSMAMSSGITVLHFNAEPNKPAQSPTELRLDLIHQILSQNGERQRVLYLDGAHIDVESLMQLKELLNRLGIKVRPCLKLAKIIG